MQPTPRDTFAPGAVDGRSSKTRNLFWPMLTGTTLIGLVIGGRFMTSPSRDNPSSGATQPSAQALDELLARYPGKAAGDAPSLVARAPMPTPAPTPVPPASLSQAEPAAHPHDAPPEARSPAPGSFILQAGSFDVKEVADAVARELTEQGFQARSEAYGGPQAGWWHVVRLGPLPTRTEAEALRLKLPLHHAKAAVVLPRSNGVYHVQVSCLKSRHPAEQMAEKLRAHAHPVRVSEASDGARGPWYCVRVGPFDSRDEAQGYQRLFEPREHMTGRVIPFAAEQPNPSSSAD